MKPFGAMMTLDLTLLRFVIVSLTWSQIISSSDFSPHFSGSEVDGEKVITTNGDGGEKCGTRIFKCGLGAVCDGTDCVCPNGTHGHAQFACVPEDYYISYITGDPKLMAFDGGSTHLFFPCELKLTSIRNRHDMGKKGGECNLQINVINYLRSNGIYVLGFHIKGLITDDSGTKFPKHFGLRLYGYEEDGDLTFKAHGKQGKIDSLYELKPWGSPSSVNHNMDDLVETHYDMVNNIAIVTINACGVELGFRPKAMHSHQLSGLLISVKKGPHVQFLDEGFPLSSFPLSLAPGNKSTPMILHVKKALALTKAEAALLLSLSQDINQDHGSSSLMCLMASRETDLMCPDARRRTFAVSVCGFMYIDPEVSQCLHANSHAESTSSLFVICIQAMCLSHNLLCRLVKIQLRRHGCHTGPRLALMPCHAIKRTMLDTYSRTMPMPASAFDFEKLTEAEPRGEGGEGRAEHDERRSSVQMLMAGLE